MRAANNDGKGASGGATKRARKEHSTRVGETENLARDEQNKKDKRDGAKVTREKEEVQTKGAWGAGQRDASLLYEGMGEVTEQAARLR